MRLRRNLFIIFFLCIIGILAFIFYTYNTGDVSNVNETIVTSKSHSEREINDAMNTIKKHFKREFNGCTLTELWYDENKSSEAEIEWANQHHAEKAILLYSNYKVDSSGGDGSLEPNRTYTNWQWILVRNNSDEQWELKTWGY